MNKIEKESKMKKQCLEEDDDNNENENCSSIDMDVASEGSEIYEYYVNSIKTKDETNEILNNEIKIGKINNTVNSNISKDNEINITSINKLSNKEEDISEEITLKEEVNNHDNIVKEEDNSSEDDTIKDEIIHSPVNEIMKSIEIEEDITFKNDQNNTLLNIDEDGDIIMEISEDEGEKDDSNNDNRDTKKEMKMNEEEVLLKIDNGNNINGGKKEIKKEESILNASTPITPTPNTTPTPTTNNNNIDNENIKKIKEKEKEILLIENNEDKINDEKENEIENENEKEKENNYKELTYKKDKVIETMTSFMEKFVDREINEKESPEEYRTRLAVKKKEEEIKIGTPLSICMKKSHYSNQKFSLEEWIPCNTIYTNDDQLYTKQVYCDAQGRLKLSREWCTRDRKIIREEGYDNLSFIAESFINEKRVICGYIFPNQDVKLWEPRADDDKAIGGLVGGKGLEDDEDSNLINYPILYCKGCNKRIKDVRYYCTYCEKPLEEDASQDTKDQQENSYNLCLYCIQCNFPSHIHPRLSFACQKLNTEFHDKQLLEQGHKKEELDKGYFKRVNESLNDTTGNVEVQKVLPKKCAFCDEGEFTSGEAFIHHYPFRPGHSKLSQPFWAHENCAYYSPGVYKSVEGHWFNVSIALEHARKTKCAECKHRGATVKCFDPGCHKTYHLSCTHKQKTYFEEGMIFWCPYHERLNEELDSWEETYSCDVC
eukprot:jgi/Orpsp1_1/1187398/evm.model.d7180000057413.1